MQLSIHHLSKTYPNGVRAINDLELEIGSGMFGLLGPNGAGKSSLMRTLATLQEADTGSIFFNDIDVLREPMRLRRVLGYLPQDFGVYPGVAAEQLLDYFARLKGIASKKERALIVDEVLQLTNLQDVRKKSVSGYSGGMKQRFGIAQLLLNRPQLIIVDEPTAGLDPAERRRFLNVLRDIGTEHIVIFSTHLVDDVKDLCTHLAVMDSGSIVYNGTPDKAIRELEGKVWKVQAEKDQLAELEKLYQVLSSGFNTDHSLTVRVFAEGKPGTSFLPAAPNLEDVYFKYLQDAQILNC
jgi:ABC-type multidrug transport system ATPase subunit